MYKIVVCFVFTALMTISIFFVGCRVSPVASVGAVAEFYYPTKQGKDQWDDPHLSRAASSNVQTSGSTSPLRPPVPGGN